MQSNTLDLMGSKTFASPKWNAVDMVVTPENALVRLNRLIESGATRAMERAVLTFGEEIDVPRTREERANSFVAWRSRLRERFTVRVKEEVTRELGEMLDSDEREKIARSIVTQLSRGIDSSLLVIGQRLSGIRWAARHYPDSIALGEPTISADGTATITVYTRQDEAVGEIALTADGDVITDATTPLEQLRERLSRAV